MRRFCCLVVVAIMVGVVALPGGRISGTVLNAAEPSLHYLYGSGSVTGGNLVSLRISLTAPAPSGGLRIRLAASNSALELPGSVRVPAGASAYAFTVATQPVDVDIAVSVRASHDGTEKARTVLIKAPRLSSLSVQSRMRAGGQGKITVRLTGPAPDAGVSVDLTTNRPSLVSGPSPVVVESGRRSVTVIVSLAHVTRDVEINVIARLNGRKLVAPSLIRNYDIASPASPTPTATASPSATASQSMTPTATAPATVTGTATTEAPGTGTPSETGIPATGTAVVTSTPTGIEFEMELVGGEREVFKGETIEFAVCVSPEPTSPFFASFRSSNETVVLQEDISPISWIFDPNSEPGTCTSVSMSGRQDASDNLGVGIVNLIVNFNGQEFISPPVTFILSPATATETVMVTASATTEPTGTPIPTSTQPASVTPTATASPSVPAATVTGTAVTSPEATAGPLDSLTIQLIGSETLFERGSTVSFEICASGDLGGTIFPTLTSSNEQVARSDDISPGNVVMTPGECVIQTLSGRTDSPQFGVGTVFLILNWNGENLQGPQVTFA